MVGILKFDSSVFILNTLNFDYSKPSKMYCQEFILCVELTEKINQQLTLWIKMNSANNVFPLTMFFFFTIYICLIHGLEDFVNSEKAMN